MHRNNYRAATAASRRDRRSDGLLLVLAIGALLLASLLTPRSSREPSGPDATAPVIQPIATPVSQAPHAAELPKDRAVTRDNPRSTV